MKKLNREMQNKSCVYWIHLPEHTDIFTQGYVGVSVTGPNKRYATHKSSAKKGSTLPIHNAIRKYGGKLILDVVVYADPLYCYELEGKLRPSPLIGYNISAGGTHTNLGSKHTEETRLKISKAVKGKKRTPEQIEQMKLAAKNAAYKHSAETLKKMSELAKARPYSQKSIDAAALANSLLPPWRNANSDKEVWKQADRIYDHMRANPTHGQKNIGRSLGIVYSKLLVVYKKIKSGWNPLLDEEWLIFSGNNLMPEVSGDKSFSTASTAN